ncbi:MAG: hypothetical protein M3466_09295, partial [Gemmatimonadota bacterium]|nr:hypothetical protein [Gemmatimonadota bacterium]
LRTVPCQPEATSYRSDLPSRYLPRGRNRAADAAGFSGRFREALNRNVLPQAVSRRPGWASGLPAARSHRLLAHRIAFRRILKRFRGPSDLRSSPRFPLRPTETSIPSRMSYHQQSHQQCRWMPGHPPSTTVEGGIKAVTRRVYDMCVRVLNYTGAHPDDEPGERVMFSYVDLERRIPTDHPLRVIQALAPRGHPESFSSTCNPASGASAGMRNVRR